MSHISYEKIFDEKGGGYMPRGKELEQLPQANTLPGMGENRSPMDRDSLRGFTDEVRPMPSKVGKAERK